MRTRILFVVCVLMTCLTGAFAGEGIAAPMPVTAAAVQDAQDDPTQVLVSRLTLDNYKTTLKGLTEFGDRRQGTQRNRDAVDWIEGQLQAFGCTNTERSRMSAIQRPGMGAPGEGAALQKRRI